MKLNGKNLCSHCMTEIPEGQTLCSTCQAAEGSSIKSSLPVETVLQGKYILGKCMYYDNTFFGYKAYDASKDEVVFIREFFPSGECCRKDKNFTLTSHTDSQLVELKKILCAASDDFCKSYKVAQKFNNRAFSLPVYDMFNENNTMYSVSAFPKGSVLLSDKLKEGLLSKTETNNIIEKVIVALGTIHSMGAIHGNIRPENIVLNGDKVYLTGYFNGSFQCIGSSSTMRIDFPVEHYAPIEQQRLNSRDNLGPAADIYALGVTWYYLLTGNLIADPYSRMTEDVSSNDVINAEILSEAEAEIIRKMTDVSAKKRYLGTDELAEAINNAGIMKLKQQVPAIMPLVEEMDEIPITGTHKVKPNGKKLVPIIIAIVATAILTLVICILIFNFGFKKQEVPPTPVDVETNDVVDDDGGEEGGEDAGKDAGDDADADTDEATEEDKSEDADADADKDKEETPGEDAGDDAKSGDDELITNPLDLFEGKNKKEDNKQEQSEVGTTWANNVMRASTRTSGDNSVLGNGKYNRKKITSVEFCDNLKNVGAKAWDVSKARNGSVKAWVSGKKLYIAANGGINAVEATSALFYNYTNLKEVNFGNAFYTEQATSMKSMFENCYALTKINFGSNFKTTKVTSMSQMFDCCRAITSLDLSRFDTSRVSDMSKMFIDCRALKTLNVTSFNTSSVMSLGEMFKQCASLTELNLNSFSISSNTSTKDMFAECKALSKVNTKDEKVLEEFQKTKALHGDLN